mmetsp:Transcript_35793/g.113808  ORF Transcript_35793/g.113808 Transcript_35793/m.113808 type:complete len:484 (-) Transcript_35793:770-2221(-)
MPGAGSGPLTPPVPPAFKPIAAATLGLTGTGPSAASACTTALLSFSRLLLQDGGTAPPTGGAGCCGAGCCGARGNGPRSVTHGGAGVLGIGAVAALPWGAGGGLCSTLAPGADMGGAALTATPPGGGAPGKAGAGAVPGPRAPAAEASAVPVPTAGAPVAAAPPAGVAAASGLGPRAVRHRTASSANCSASTTCSGWPLISRWHVPEASDFTAMRAPVFCSRARTQAPPLASSLWVMLPGTSNLIVSSSRATSLRRPSEYGCTPATGTSCGTNLRAGSGPMPWTTSLIITSALATASFSPVMRTTQGSLLLSMSTLAPLFSWMSLIWRPPGPISRPVQLGGTSTAAAASPRIVLSLPSRTSVTIFLAKAMLSGKPEKRTMQGSTLRSMSIFAPLLSCSSWIRAPPAPMTRPTAERLISMNSPSWPGSVILAISTLASLTWLCVPTIRTRQPVGDLSTSIWAPLFSRTSEICCPRVPMILPVAW